MPGSRTAYLGRDDGSVWVLLSLKHWQVSLSVLRSRGCRERALMPTCNSSIYVSRWADVPSRDFAYPWTSRCCGLHHPRRWQGNTISDTILVSEASRDGSCWNHAERWALIARMTQCDYRRREGGVENPLLRIEWGCITVSLKRQSV